MVDNKVYFSGVLNQFTTSEISHWKLLSIVLSAASSIMGLVISVAGFIGLENIYRPWGGGPETNQLVALCIFMLGYATFVQTFNITRLVQRVFIILVLSITHISVVDALLGTEIHEVFTPFQNIFRLEHPLRMQTEMGFNSATMLFLASISLSLLIFNQRFMSQLAGLMALSIPLLSIIGYLYQTPGLYGQMSLITAILGFSLTQGIYINSLNSEFSQSIIVTK